MKKFLWVCIFIAASFPARAEMLVCTQMWCQEGLTVNLQSQDWPAGDYRFVLALDEKTVICQGKLPFADCDGAVTCDTEGVTIGESGCALPADSHHFNTIMVKDIPQHVILDIMRGDGKAFGYQSAVDAKCGYPNGEQCDIAQCCSAALDAPIVWD